MNPPRAAYRLQFKPTVGFLLAEHLLDYLSHLGISHIYASPIFKATKGSTHGYDVVDPTQLNPELGSVEEFQHLMTQVEAKGMSWVQDIVSNHMAFAPENMMLMNVLEQGPASPYFKFFDTDWDHTYESLKGKLLVPFLGKPYAECLENGEIKLTYDSTGLKVNYYEHRFPLHVESYYIVFSHRLDVLEESIGKQHPDTLKFLGILYLLKPPAITLDQVELGKKMLWELHSENAKIREFIDGNIQFFNGTPGIPESFNLLDDLLSRQYFRLAFWKVATEEINYRRFFNINGLISLNVQHSDVMANTHAFILRMIQENKFSGLRVDHIDGLYDPTNYLKKLREKAPEAYVVVEKILELEESLPDWPVQGTTGYDFLNYLNGLFCQTENEAEISRVYSRFASFPYTFEQMLWNSKRSFMEKQIASDIDNLAHLMKKVFSRHRYGRDITLYALRKALFEVMALFPVYRTYISLEGITERDKTYIQSTVAKAKEINHELWYNLNLVEKFLLLDFDKDLSAEERDIWIHFVMRFQQFTSPLMAKALEDTLFYVYNRLLSLNEVGGNPQKFGISRQEFHEFNIRRTSSFPYSMNATSTHDTKRSEDVRARLNVLSEIPQEWEAVLGKWS